MNKRIQGKRNRAKGEIGELIASRALNRLGYKYIRRIHTPWRIHRVKGRIVSATPMEAVGGDFRAVGPDGISVLAEVKMRDTETLTYSTLEQHQRASLYEHHEAGGLSLLIWVHQRIAYVMCWPIEGFKPRSSIKIEDAKDLQKTLT